MGPLCLNTGPPASKMSCILTLEELEDALECSPFLYPQDAAEVNSLHQLSSGFNVVHDFLKPAWPVPAHYLPQASPPSDQVILALACILQKNCQEELFEWYKDQIHLGFKDVQAESQKMVSEWQGPFDYQLVLRLVARWHVIFMTWYDPLRVLTPQDTSAYDLYSKHFYSLLLRCVPDAFPAALKMLFTADLTTSSLLFTPTSAQTSTTPIRQLSTLGLLNRFQPILFSVGYDAIDERIDTVCRGQWVESPDACLEGMLNWFREEIGMWLLKVLEAADDCSGSPSEQTLRRGRVIEILRPAMSRFEYHIYKSLSELRISELFDIIVEFPDTMPVLQDLRICLIKTDQRSQLVHKLRESNTKRLLHPGADTQDIITQYISLMKALRVLDPPGVLLTCVAQPVRSYLRSRDDTIRCIVSSLVEPGHSLGEELDQTSENDQGTGGPTSGLPLQEEGDYGSTNWTPDPVDAPIGYKNVLKEDVIESLVSIYETRDGFVKELQNLLASRLLAVKGFDVTQELTRIEILKRKFGEANLQPCDIMLKDIADSKRVDTAVHEVIPDAPIHVVIISRLFWPELVSSAFRFSPRLVELQKAFEKAYTSQKVDRRLRWLPQLGSVEVEVELEDRTLDLEVTTLQASLIELFSTADTWTMPQLVDKLKLNSDPGLLRNGLYYWSNLEVLKEVEAGVWKLFETRESFKSSSVGIRRHVIEDHVSHPDSHQAKADKIRVFSAFLVGMLTNVGGLPLDRIFVMMNMAMPAFKGTSKEELLDLLELMQREGTICLSGLVWKIAK